jgi:hypothetical protein
MRTQRATVDKAGSVCPSHTAGYAAGRASPHRLCKVTPVILHGVVSPDSPSRGCKGEWMVLHGVVSPEGFERIFGPKWAKSRLRYPYEPPYVPTLLPTVGPMGYRLDGLF